MDPVLQMYTSIALALGVVGTGMGAWYVISRTKAEHLSKRQEAAGYTIAAGNRSR